MKPKRFEIDIDWGCDEVKELGKVVLPDPDLLIYFNRLNKRHIFINDYIDEELVEYSYQIIQWNIEDKDLTVEQRIPIKIFINSNGGCLNSVMNFINTIQLSKTPVFTIAMGKGYSAGGLLLMAGNKGNRYIFPDTSVLIHDGSTGAIGDTSKVIDNLEFTQKQEERIKKFILANTNITAKLYEKNYRRNWFMFEDEIIRYGIADKVIERLDELF